MKKKRDYKKEAAWEDQPAQVKRRMARNRANALMKKKGLIHKGDGQEVDHKSFTRRKTDKLDNSVGNLRVISKHANRIKQPKRKGR